MPSSGDLPTAGSKQMRLLSKRCAALAKLIGSALLLGAYVTQNFQYEDSNARSIALVSAMRDRQLIDNSALLQEVLYFEVSSSRGEFNDEDLRAVRSSKARLAATKGALSLSVAINGAKILSPAQASVVLRELFQRAKGVSSYDDLLKFFEYGNTLPAVYSRGLNDQYETEVAARASARKFYLGLYLLATAITLFGLGIEWWLTRDA